MMGHKQGERSSVQEKLEESMQCLENRAGLSESLGRENVRETHGGRSYNDIYHVPRAVC